MSPEHDPQTLWSTQRSRIEWWGLLRGLVLLFSTFLGVTLVYVVIRTVFGS
jgi:hypothetical protein